MSRRGVALVVAVAGSVGFAAWWRSSWSQPAENPRYSDLTAGMAEVGSRP